MMGRQENTEGKVSSRLVYVEVSRRFVILLLGLGKLLLNGLDFLLFFDGQIEPGAEEYIYVRGKIKTPS